MTILFFEICHGNPNPARGPLQTLSIFCSWRAIFWHGFQNRFIFPSGIPVFPEIRRFSGLAISNFGNIFAQNQIGQIWVAKCQCRRKTGGIFCSKNFKNMVPFMFLGLRRQINKKMWNFFHIFLLRVIKLKIWDPRSKSKFSTRPGAEDFQREISLRRKTKGFFDFRSCFYFEEIKKLRRQKWNFCQVFQRFGKPLRNFSTSLKISMKLRIFSQFCAVYQR